MKHFKTLTRFSILLFLLTICTGCFTTYHRFDKTPCADLGPDPKSSIKAVALERGYKEEDIEVTDTYVRYTKKKSFEYLQIKKAMITTKKMLKGKRYSIVIVLKDRKKHSFETFNYNLAIKAYSTLECLAGIKPKTQNAPPADKYDKLNKLKALLDNGTITQEEYDLEKKKILDSN